MVFMLCESDVQLLASLLQWSAQIAVDNLKAVDHADQSRGDPRIDPLRDMVSTHLALRNRLLDQLADHQEGDAREQTRKIRDDGIHCIVNRWNAEIARILATPEAHACDADACDIDR